MLEQLSRNWWAVGLRGICAIGLGVVAFSWPAITLAVVVYLFGAYVIVDGILAIVTAGVLALAGRRWVWLLFEGVVSIFSGLVAFIWPGITALALLLIVAAYAFATGLLEITTAFHFRKLRGNPWLLGLSGVVSILFGILLVVWPDSGLLTLVWLLGFYALFFGFMLLGLAFQLYRLHNGIKRGSDFLTI